MGLSSFRRVDTTAMCAYFLETKTARAGTIEFHQTDMVGLFTLMLTFWLLIVPVVWKCHIICFVASHWAGFRRTQSSTTTHSTWTELQVAAW